MEGIHALPVTTLEWIFAVGINHSYNPAVSWSLTHILYVDFSTVAVKVKSFIIFALLSSFILTGN